MVFLKAGVITTSHGIRGGLRIKPLTDEPSRFCKLTWLYLENSDQKWPVTEVTVRNKDIIVYLEGIDHIDQAEALRGQYGYTDESQRAPLEEDQYYVRDLIGLSVRLSDGTKVGTVTDVLESGTHDVYVVTSLDGKREWMIPAIKDFVPEISIEEGWMKIEPIEGMLS